MDHSITLQTDLKPLLHLITFKFQKNQCNKTKINATKKDEISTVKSFNILTWHQILPEEKLEIFLPAIESIYVDKSKLNANLKHCQQIQL